VRTLSVIEFTVNYHSPGKELLNLPSWPLLT